MPVGPLEKSHTGRSASAFSLSASERRRLLAPTAGVHRAAQHHRPVRGQVADPTHRQMSSSARYSPNCPY
ncbi:MAG: hypothetical protein AB1556_06705 [Bacillota bacterium]